VSGKTTDNLPLRSLKRGTKKEVNVKIGDKIRNGNIYEIEAIGYMAKHGIKNGWGKK
jgi:hypothetical protein